MSSMTFESIRCFFVGEPVWNLVETRSTFTGTSVTQRWVLISTDCLFEEARLDFLSDTSGKLLELLGCCIFEVA